MAELRADFARDGIARFCVAYPGEAIDSSPVRYAIQSGSGRIDDRRFAETIYRVALADGIMDCVTYQDPPEDAS